MIVGQSLDETPSQTAGPDRRSAEPTSGSLSLRRGDGGDAVLDLQRRLALIGYSTEGEHREFGRTTEVALRDFQRDRGLVVDGICGPHSWNSLVEAEMRLGDRLLYYRAPMMRGDDVEELQRRLGRLGFDTRWVDGIFGPSTQAATRHFQQNVGLPADGVVGHSTVAALDRLAGRQAGEITVAQVREQERLRHQPSSVEGKRIVVGDTGELPVIAQAVARRLRRAGAEVLSFSTPDLRHQARTSNQWRGDVYLGVTLAVDNFGVSYFAMPGFVSTGGRALAGYCADALASVLPETASALPMRLPILRETRMPAVWCRIGPGSLVVLRAPQLAHTLADALVYWCRQPFA